MQFLELKTQLKDFLLFSVEDIKKVDADFHSQRLSEWQEKGYIKKITKDYYIFSDLAINESILFLVANKIYSPSYVSLEMALSYYGLIPEGVYGITSVTSRKTNNIKTAVGEFIYSRIKPSLMFGYRLEGEGVGTFKIADMEKALIDYFYIHPDIKTNDDFIEMRFNEDEFKEKADKEKLDRYLAALNSKSLEARIKRFQKFIKYA